MLAKRSMTIFDVIFSGAYQGVGPYVPYYWESLLRGQQKENCRVYKVTTADIKRFPSLARDGYINGDQITICECDGIIAPLHKGDTSEL